MVEAGIVERCYGMCSKQGTEDHYLTHQNLVEFWRSATRPLERNGLGMSLAEAEAELHCVEALFPILPDVPEIYPEWKRIVLEYRVMGVNVHDARLVAVILVHGLTQKTMAKPFKWTYKGKVLAV